MHKQSNTNLIQLKQNASDEINPKLVVGIVVDQMRYDYLTRFELNLEMVVLRRMMHEGFNCKNNHYNYVPTYTGPGHASVYTGTTPKYHGIIANYWYDKELRRWCIVLEMILLSL